MRFNLDFIAKGSFQTAPNGQRLFYPNGLAGKGYWIDSEETYQRLFRQQKRWGISIMAMISLLVAAKVGWTVMLPLFVALNLLKQAAVRKTTRTMQVSDIPYSVDGFFREGIRLPRMSQAMQVFLLGAGGLGCVGLLAAIAWQPDMWRKFLGWSFVGGLVAYLALRELRGDNLRNASNVTDVSDASNRPPA